MSEFVEERHGKLLNDVFFLQEDTPAHKSLIAVQEAHEIGFELVDHYFYSTNLTLTGDYLLSKIKHLKLLSSGLLC